MVNSEPAQTQLVRRNRGVSVIAGSSARHGLPDQRSPLSLCGRRRDAVAEISEAGRAGPDETRREDAAEAMQQRRRRQRLDFRFAILCTRRLIGPDQPIRVLKPPVDQSHSEAPLPLYPPLAG